MTKPKIGFIGQGWIGKNYANDFEERGYEVVRYALESPYIKNKDKIKDCDIVFIAVPTPTTPDGFSDNHLIKVLPLVGDGKIAVIKSTLIPGTTKKLQEIFSEKIILHSPEFLTEATAEYDARHPNRNIIGYTDKRGEEAAHKVMDVLPSAPFKSIVKAEEAEITKYGGNCWFYFKVVFMNLLYDLCSELGVDYEQVKRGMSFDPRIGYTHLDVVHQGGRGAGGHCFIKDFAAFKQFYKKTRGKDVLGNLLLDYMESKNIQLLKSSNKSIDLLKQVYGKQVQKN